MAKKDIVHRLKLAVQKYLAGTPSAAAVTALLTGKSVEEIGWLRVPTKKESDGLVQLQRDVTELERKAGNPSDEAFLAAVRDEILGWAKPQGLLVTYCGPSSVGKDVVASHVRGRLKCHAVHSEYLRKYTTRHRRGESPPGVLSGGELEPSSNYVFLSEEQFDKSTDIFFRYNLYGFRYGFSQRGIRAQGSENALLQCINGRLEKIYSFRRSVYKVSRRLVFAILLVAPARDLYQRLILRHSLRAPEKAERHKVLAEQLDYIKANRQALEREFDLVVENGNSNPLAGTVDMIESELVERGITIFAGDTG